MPAKKTVSGKDFHQAEPLDLRATYHVLREKLWLILLFVITAACVTGAYLYRAPRI